MAIKHNSILPYYECCGLILTIWPSKELNFDREINLTIAKRQGTKYSNVYEKPWDRPALIYKLEKESVKQTLDLANILTEAEIENLEREKPDIIEYFKTINKQLRFAG